MALSVKVAVICVVVAMVVGCTGQVASPSPGPSGTAGASNRPSQEPTASFDPTKSAWQNVLGRVGPNGEVDLQTALDSFVLAMGPLPGVDRPPGDAGPIVDGTFAVRAVRRNWAALTPEQQQAAERLIRGSLPSAERAPRALAVVGSAGELGGGQVQDDAATEGWQHLAEQAAAAIAGHLHHGLKATIDVQLNPEPPPGESPYIWESWGYTYGEDAQGEYDGPMATCHIRINPQGQAASSVEQYALAAHEVFHCYQFDVGTLAAHDNDSDWVIEGSAEWVGEEIAGGTNLSVGWWEEWLTTPAETLFARTYDAIGIYALLDDVGVDPWSVMNDFLLAAINGNEAAYAVLRSAGGDAFIDTWGPRYAMAPANGPNWAFVGIGLIPNIAEFGEPAVSASPGSSAQLTAADHAAMQFDVALQSEVVAFDSSTTHGIGQLQAGTDVALAALVAQPLCTSPTGCTCPAGTAGAGVSFQAATAGSVVQVGFAGDEAEAGVQVTGVSLDDFCHQAHVDPCLVGTWVSTNASVPDHDVIGGDGIILTIGADGSVTEDYDLMNALLVTPTVQPVPEVAFSVELQWFGTASGHIRAAQGAWLVLDSNVDDQRWSLSVFLNGHETKVFDHATAAEVGPGGGTSGLGGQTGDEQLGGIGGLGGLADGIYVCGEGTLLIKPNTALGALNWLKQ